MNNLKGFIAEVRDHKGDKWKSGRVKLRIYGKHDNEQDIKDEDLPWGMPLQDITSAATNRTGSAPVGMVQGSRVFGVFLDEEEQYPIILGTFSRAGKLKQEDDNTGGEKDIDEKYSDTPLAAIGKKKSNTLAKKTTDKRDDKLKKDSKYNKKDYTKEDEAEDPLEKSREKNAKKTGDLKTVAAANSSGGSLLSKILQVDNQNESGALPMAPQMFQQILQVGNMTGGGGLNGLTGGAMGGMLGGLSGNFGVGQIMGQLSGAMGIDISMLSGMTGMLGGMGGGGGGSGSNSGIGGTTPSGPGYAETAYTGYVPTTPNDISVTAAELLNQLGGFKTATGEIEGMSIEDRQALYIALINLLNSVDENLYVNTTINISYSQTINITTGEIIDPGKDPINLILPGSYVDNVLKIPDGYLLVFSFTDTDPYPGFMQWLGPTGDVIFCPRPEDRPWTSTPEEDVMNVAILQLIQEILLLVRQGKLTISFLIEKIQQTRQIVTNQGMQNAHGKGANNNNIGQIAQQLLGMLGQLVQKAQQNHIMDSFLDQSKMSETLKNYQKKGSDLRRKKQLAKQAVSQKNQNGGLNPSGLLNFGSGAGGGGQNSGNQPNASSGQGYGNTTSKVVTYITKTGNVVNKVETLPASASNAVNFGYYSIYKA